MLPYPQEIKQKAIHYRQRGYSLKEICEILHISKSTSSLWVSDVKLTKKVKNILDEKHNSGLKEANKKLSSIRIANKRKEIETAKTTISKIPKTNEVYKILCAMLYWAEGQKIGNHHVAFTNSDPQMIKAFLNFLRIGFDIDEKKFRVIVHIHNYHNDSRQKKYWSQITNIPLNQFTKSYLKPNTKSTIRQNYQGCVRISYYSATIWHEIEDIYKNINLL